MSLLTLLFLPVAAGAQTGPEDGGPDPANVKVRIGPLMLNPRIEVPNIGVDTNVFNQTADQNPKKDFTATVSPITDLWLRVGRSWFRASIREDLVWFQTYASERSANAFYTVGWRMPFNRLVFDVEPDYVSTRDRPGFEIDARSQRTEWGAKSSVQVRVLSKTFLGVTASRVTTDFDSFATFDGVNLREALNRTVSTAGIVVKHQLTPLTTISLNIDREQDRFQFSPERDSNSTAFSGTVTFDPHALLKGNASFGYRDFQPVLPGLPPYQGPTMGGTLTYTLLGTTQFGFQFQRDVGYSYDVTQPYYVQTGVSGSMSQQIFGPFDAVVRAGTQQLAYRDQAGVTVDVPNRTDYVRSFGGGVGYHFSSGLRIGFNVDQQHRITDVAQFRYDGLRYGTSVTYAF